MARRVFRELSEWPKVAEYQCEECDKEWIKYQCRGGVMKCPASQCEAETWPYNLRWPNEDVSIHKNLYSLRCALVVVMPLAAHKNET